MEKNPRRYTHEEIKADLAYRINEYGLVRTARKLGLSKQYVFAVNNGIKDIGAAFAKAMGYNRIVEYERI